MHNIYIYIFLMALTTYLIRLVPLILVDRKIQNKFILSFLYYVPYVVLSAMLFPSMLYSTSSIFSAGVGIAVALILSYFNKSLVSVACMCALSVYIVEFLLKIH